MAFWLMKTEPSYFSIDDLKRQKISMWDGVRNYQARNFMRAMKKGDTVLVYHSNKAPVGIAGIAEIVRVAYPDPTQFDVANEHHDKKATLETPRWDAVNIRFVKKFKQVLTLHELKNDPHFETMPVTQKGSRLSVQPVSEHHFKRVYKLGT